MQNIKCIFTTGVIFSGLLIWSQPSLGHQGSSVSHSGGTDKCGCHTNRKTGEYHCHTRKQRGGSCPASFNKAKKKSIEDKSSETHRVKTV